MTYFCINDGMVEPIEKASNKYCPLCGLIVIKNNGLIPLGG